MQELDRRDLQTGKFFQLDVITFSKEFQVLRTVKNPTHGSGWDKRGLQTGNFR